MSYCVNCGVELEQAAKRCPLCTTVVVNPSSPQIQEEIVPAYPAQLAIPKPVQRRYAAFLVSMTLLIPNMVCCLVNLLFPQTGQWAMYINASSLLVWMLFVMPFLWRKISVYFVLFLDALSIGLFLYVLFGTQELPKWYWNLAVPVVIAVFTGLFFLVFWLGRKKHEWPSIVIMVFLCGGAGSLFLGLLFQSYFNNPIFLYISYILTLCCAALVGFFAYVRQSRRFRAFLSRKFFV